MADKIYVRQLVLPCRIGVTDEERAEKQRVIVDLTLDLDLSQAGKSDRLQDTLDYRLVQQQVTDLVTGSPFCLLERLAQAIADVCLTLPRVRAVRVRVDKPGALRLADSTGVEIERKDKGGNQRWIRNA
jgi:FolB domain-containing protein